MAKLTINRLRNTNFYNLYKKLLNSQHLNDNEKSAILSMALYFVGLDNLVIQKLGYRLFLLYSKTYKDYKPLYEISINKGLIPIAQFIDEKLEYSSKYWNLYNEINMIQYQIYRYKDIYQTIEQKHFFTDVKQSASGSQVVVAPTSYGKTDLILQFIEEAEGKNICVVSPTKALLAQTKKRIMDAINPPKVITNPDMFNKDYGPVLAVLTQERFLKLLQNNPELLFDIIIIDEAHNLLEKSNDTEMRSIILASVIAICKKRNQNTIFKYLTPFIKSKESLCLRGFNLDATYHNVSEYIKSELYYYHNLKEGERYIVDQFSMPSNCLIFNQQTFLNDVDVVINNQSEKNLIYLNKPSDIEKFAHELYFNVGLKHSSILDKASEDLKSYIHEDYKLAQYIKKGIIYHHGSIPEAVRYYLEELYTNNPDLIYLVANSTLLEGINIPLTRMFILDPYKGKSRLNASSFINLTGRVCRLGEIFNNHNGNLDYLLPEIHIVNGKYCTNNFSIKNFISHTKMLMNSNDLIVDEVENPLLTNSNTSDKSKEKAQDILENISINDVITDNYERKPNTRIGNLCFANNVNIFDIFELEDSLSKEIDNATKCFDLSQVFALLDLLFFSRINLDFKDEKVKRLKNVDAQNFYKMLINWRIIGLGMKEMVTEFIHYWDGLSSTRKKHVYVGKWGDKEWHGHAKLWTDIANKNYFEKVNLAIVRIKEEYDFLDFEIMKYVDIINSLDLIDLSLYNKIKYGSDDMNKIALLNFGLSSLLINLLTDKYSNYYSINGKDNTILFSNDLINKMIENGENGILITEVKMNICENPE